jgi:hypothetical protein
VGAQPPSKRPAALTGSGLTFIHRYRVIIARSDAGPAAEAS